MKYGDLKSYINVAATLNCQATIQPEDIKKIKRMLDDAEKYRWHDLRKNPLDLPEEDDCEFKLCLVDGKRGNVTWMVSPIVLEYMGNKTWSSPDELEEFEWMSVIAWKNIEDLEEVEVCTK